MNTPAPVYIRCDASKKHGLGHLSRCLILADALASMNLCPIFLVAENDHVAQRIIGAQNRQIYRIPSGLSYRAEIVHYPADCIHILTDLQHLDNVSNPGPLEEYISTLMDLEKRVIFIDGLFDDAFRSAAVTACIQPYLGAEADVAPDASHWIKGAKFALISQDLGLLPTKPLSPTARTLLITFGGSDPQGITAFVMEALRDAPDGLSIRVVIGPYFSAEHIPQIKAVASKYPGRFDVQPPQKNMMSHYQWADMAVGSSGMSRYEFAASGVPAVFVSLCPEHMKSSESFARSGIAKHLGLYSDITQETWLLAIDHLQMAESERRAMILAGKNTIDGRGSLRLAAAIKGILHGT